MALWLKIYVVHPTGADDLKPPAMSCVDLDSTQRSLFDATPGRHLARVQRRHIQR